jgi:hypothetical protein
MAPNLKQASQTRRRTKLNNSAKSAADKVASKLAKTANSNSSTTAITPTPSAPKIDVATGNGQIKVNIPGLPEITPDKLSGMMPQFNPEAYQITDPLNPPESMPQATQEQFDKGMRIYEGAVRALKLTGAAFDTTREKFNVGRKQAQAFGAGVLMATEIEKTKGNYFDYLKTLETNEQKTIALDIAQYQTTQDRAKAPHQKSQMDEALKQAEIAADDARLKTQEKQNQLNQFKESLGAYAGKK